MSGALLLTSCQSQSEGFDGKSFDISNAQDNSLTASLAKISGGYSLTVEGSGKAIDFTDSYKAPWYSIAKKVKEVTINEGVTSFGTNTFNKIGLSSFVLPSSLKEVTDSSFKEGVELYSYSDSLLGAENYRAYYYSESVPTDESKNYWHIVNDSPVLWKTYKVLFIGNSFTFYNDIPGLTQSIATDLGYSLKADSVTVGSHKLSQYADSSDEYGAQVEAKLKANDDYDFVILQEQSTTPLNNYSSFSRGVKALLNKINSTQKSCETRLYATWGFDEEAKAHNWTIPEMEANIRAKYEECAATYKLKVHQVGKAFSDAYSNFNSINLYHTDNKHPSYYGSYLSALVHTASLLGADVRKTHFKGTIQDETIASSLKEVAYRTVFNN